MRKIFSIFLCPEARFSMNIIIMRCILNNIAALKRSSFAFLYARRMQALLQTVDIKMPHWQEVWKIHFWRAKLGKIFHTQSNINFIKKCTVHKSTHFQERDAWNFEPKWDVQIKFSLNEMIPSFDAYVWQLLYFVDIAFVLREIWAVKVSYEEVQFALCLSRVSIRKLTKCLCESWKN